MNNQFVQVCVFLALATTVFGCSRPDPVEQYTVKLDVSMSTIEHQEEARAAIQDWAERLPAKTFVAIETGVDCTFEDGVICMTWVDQPIPGRLGQMVDFCTQKVDGITPCGRGGVVQLHTTSEKMQQTIEHEMGHAMGLVHQGPGVLMAPNRSIAAKSVTDEDVDQWYSVHATAR